MAVLLPDESLEVVVAVVVSERTAIEGQGDAIKSGEPRKLLRLQLPPGSTADGGRQSRSQCRWRGR